jgi:NADH:flavin oxidoreductase / NADH oxidase family
LSRPASAVAMKGHVYTHQGPHDFIKPKPPSGKEIQQSIRDFATAARKAIAAGFDGSKSTAPTDTASTSCRGPTPITDLTRPLRKDWPAAFILKPFTHPAQPALRRWTWSRKASPTAWPEVCGGLWGMSCPNRFMHT